MKKQLAQPPTSDSDGLTQSATSDELAQPPTCDKVAQPSTSGKQAQQSTIDILAQLLMDDEFIEKHILTNSYIWGKFKTAMIKEIIETQAPHTMRGGGGVQMKTPQAKPKNLQEAAKMTEKYLSKR